MLVYLYMSGIIYKGKFKEGNSITSFLFEQLHKMHMCETYPRLYMLMGILGLKVDGHKVNLHGTNV